MPGDVHPVDGFLQSCFTVPINAATGTITIRAATPGKRWVCIHLFISSASSVTLVFSSGATALSGDLTCNTTLEFRNGGFPVFAGEALNEAFVVTQSGTVALDGFAVLKEVEQT